MHGIECRGFGRINNECNLFYLTQNHCHTEEAYKSKLIALNNKIKYTIFIQEQHHAFPAIHFLMSSKNENLYTAVLQKIVEMIPDFQPELAVGDYEKASRNTFRKIFPSITVSGFLFHYSKAIWKKVKKLQLSSTYSKNTSLNEWIKFVISLSMLPEEEIFPTFQILVNTVPKDLSPREDFLLNKIRF